MGGGNNAGIYPWPVGCTAVDAAKGGEGRTSNRRSPRDEKEVIFFFWRNFENLASLGLLSFCAFHRRVSENRGL